MNRSYRGVDIPNMDLLNALMQSGDDNLVFAELLSRLTERAELQQILDLQHSRVTVVTKEWQKSHGKPNVIPDLGMLIDWMWGQVKVCEFVIDNRKKPEVVLAEQYCPLCGGPVKG